MPGMLSSTRSRLIAAVVLAAAAALAAALVLRPDATPEQAGPGSTPATAPPAAAAIVPDPRVGTLTEPAGAAGPSPQTPVTVPQAVVSAAPATLPAQSEVPVADLAAALPVEFRMEQPALPYDAELTLASSTPPVAAAALQDLFEASGWLVTTGAADPMRHPFTLVYPGLVATLTVTQSPAGAHASVAVLHVEAA